MTHASLSKPIAIEVNLKYIILIPCVEINFIYADMVKLCEEACMLGIPFSIEERNLLSVAFNNALSLQRTPCRVYSGRMCREECLTETETTRMHLKLIKAQMDKIDQEFCNTCYAAIKCYALLADLPENTPQEKVLYSKS